MFCIPSFDEMTDLTPYLNHVIPAYAGIQTVSHSANQVEGTSETGSVEYIDNELKSPALPRGYGSQYRPQYTQYNDVYYGGPDPYPEPHILYACLSLRSFFSAAEDRRGLYPSSTVGTESGLGRVLSPAVGTIYYRLASRAGSLQRDPAASAVLGLGQVFGRTNRTCHLSWSFLIGKSSVNDTNFTLVTGA